MMEDRLKIRQKVEFHARTIYAEVQNGTVMMGVTNFSRTQIIAARPRTLVEFEAGISREEAMAALMALRKEIKANGLPATSWSIDRKPARVFDKILKECATGKRHYDRLSPKGQQKLREFLALKNQHKSRETIGFSEQFFRIIKWSV